MHERRRSGCGWTVAAAALCVGMGARTALAQQTPKVPATDAAVQASPATTDPKHGLNVDGSAQASPEIGPVLKGGGLVLAPKTALPITLTQALDSSKLKNGQHVAGQLSAAVGRMPAGTPVTLSVIATVPAGVLNAAGEFSLELVAVGRAGVYTDTQTFRGKPGHKDLPDSAPALGTNAGLPDGAPLTFHVQPPPVAADGAPGAGRRTPGSVDGTAIGSQGTPKAAASAGAGSGTASGTAANGQGGQIVNPGNTTSVPVNGGANGTNGGANGTNGGTTGAQPTQPH